MNRKNFFKNIKTIIFDMDGVISDTMRLHANVDTGILKKLGIEISTEEFIEKYRGITTKEIFEELFKQYRVKEKVNKAVKEKWDIMYKIVPGKIKPIPWAKELIRYFKNKGFKLAVASSCPSRFIKLVLKELKLGKYFDVLVSGANLKKSKPNPKIFLLVAKKLKVKPKHCLVIEDGPSGMIAAKRAGMKCIGLVEKTKKGYPADLVVENLSEIFKFLN